jgi:hypothetical protein
MHGINSILPANYHGAAIRGMLLTIIPKKFSLSEWPK